MVITVVTCSRLIATDLLCVGQVHGLNYAAADQVRVTRTTDKSNAVEAIAGSEGALGYEFSERRKLGSFECELNFIVVMSSYDSYLFNHQLPDNETYKMIHNILIICTCVIYGLSYLIIYLSPPSKESYYYKMLVHAQGALLFLFSILYSILLKLISHFNYNFYYCEGYCYLIGLTCANVYTILCFIFGSYAVTLVGSYLFRLYLIVDHTHFLRKPYLFPIICAVIEFFFSFVSSVTFYIGYSEFEPSSLPFNLSQKQLDYMSTKTALSYHLKTFKEIFYPVYFASLIILTLVIIRTIHRKQSLMSTGASSHHLKVLKILTIQIVCTASLGVCVPFALIFSLFSPVNSTIIYGYWLLMGANSLALSLLTICLVSRKTALTLIGWYRPKRKTTIRVDAKDSTFVK